MNLNCWNGCGRITYDSEMRFTKNNTAMTKFRIAVNDRRDDDTTFVDVLCFGKTAETLTQYLTKGTLVGVTGKIKLDEYETRDGEKRSSLKCIADNITLGPKSAKNESAVTQETQEETEPGLFNE